MQDFERQAEAALELYLQRGRLALKLLQRHRLDAALPVLKLRTAAFHNFRVADVLRREVSKGAGKSGEVEVRWQSLWIAIERVDARLAEVLERMKSEASRELEKVCERKIQLAKFRSHKPYSSSFEKSV